MVSQQEACYSNVKLSKYPWKKPKDPFISKKQNLWQNEVYKATFSKVYTFTFRRKKGWHDFTVCLKIWKQNKKS